jgi:type I restriction enzyme M protein
VPTRLLDWTLNPLVALYFAVERSSRGHHDTDAAVYVAQQYSDIIHEEVSPLSVEKVTLISPKNVSARVLAQSALLTLHPKPDEAYAPADMVKVLIARRAQPFIHHMLHFCGIHRASLFPGLDGLADELTYWLTRSTLPPSVKS